MNYKIMGRLCAFLLCALSVFMIPSAILCFADGVIKSGLAFLYTILGSLAVSAVLFLLCRGADSVFFAKEGVVSVGLCWILMGAVGALPFYISGEIPRYIDALFESVSGFTTTGASILKNVEALSRGAIYWRSFSHFLGGMGVLVFLLAIIPVNRKAQGYTMHLLRAESPGPDVGKLVPKMRTTALILYVTYFCLTLLMLVFLLFGKMPLFDAICTSLATAGTGGFGLLGDSMASYTPYIQTVTAVFMLLFGVNFGCYFLLLMRNVRGVLRDEELRLYLVTVAVAVALITVNTYPLYERGGEALHHAFFQVASIITTTGFSSVDFNLWPTFSKAILIVLMFFGGCAGSTAGGLKCSRILIYSKGLRRNVAQVLRPRKIKTVRISGTAVDERIITSTNTYLCVYFCVLFASFLLLSLDSVSFETAFTSVVACINNIGPGLDAVGPMASYADLSVLSKLTLVFNMLAGRLELFPILVLFHKDAWRRI